MAAVCMPSNAKAKPALAHNNAVAHNSAMSKIQDALTVLRRTMSQAEIAQAIGVNQSRISRWEAGHVSSGADAAAKLIALAKEKTADASPELAEKAQA